MDEGDDDVGEEFRSKAGGGEGCGECMASGVVGLGEVGGGDYVLCMDVGGFWMVLDGGGVWLFSGSGVVWEVICGNGDCGRASVDSLAAAMLEIEIETSVSGILVAGHPASSTGLGCSAGESETFSSAVLLLYSFLVNLSALAFLIISATLLIFFGWVLVLLTLFVIESGSSEDLD